MAIGQTTRLARTSGAWVMVVSGGLLLSGCAEGSLFVHTTKTLTAKPSERPAEVTGKYKIGTPYQIDGVWYTPREDYAYVEEGTASWYGPDFHGKDTANGETYDMQSLTAAHRTLPMPSVVRVTNLENGRSAILRVNDRGPFAQNRILDVSKRAAETLGFLDKGTARVRVEILAEESVALKEHMQRGDDYTGTPVQVASLAPAPVGAVYATEELPPPPGTTAAARPEVPTAATYKPQASAVTMTAAKSAAVVAAGLQYIQVGAFSDQANALRLKNRLSNLGQAQISTAKAPNGVTLHKVRLGPFADAETLQATLDNVHRSGFPEARAVAQ